MSAALPKSLPFPSGAFDKVVSVSCLEHFRDPAQGLREMIRVLKPGGRLAISVDSLLAENSPAAFREWHQKRHFVTTYFTAQQLLALMTSGGIRCEPERTGPSVSIAGGGSRATIVHSASGPVAAVVSRSLRCRCGRGPRRE